MTIEAGLYAKLKEIARHDRVYPDAIPNEQTLWPCIVYMHNGDDEEFCLSGPPPTDHIDLFTLELWGPDRAVIATLRDALKTALAGENCQGVWGGAGGVVVAGAFCRDAAADVSPAEDGSDNHDRAERLSLKIIWYS